MDIERIEELYEWVRSDELGVSVPERVGKADGRRLLLVPFTGLSAAFGCFGEVNERYRVVSYDPLLWGSNDTLMSSMYRVGKSEGLAVGLVTSIVLLRRDGDEFRPEGRYVVDQYRGNQFKNWPDEPWSEGMREHAHRIEVHVTVLDGVQSTYSAAVPFVLYERNSVLHYLLGECRDRSADLAAVNELIEAILLGQEMPQDVRTFEDWVGMERLYALCNFGRWYRGSAGVDVSAVREVMDAFGIDGASLRRYIAETGK